MKSDEILAKFIHDVLITGCDHCPVYLDQALFDDDCGESIKCADALVNWARKKAEESEE